METKRIKVGIMCLLGVWLVLTRVCQAYSGGSGTVDDPYQIANKVDLLILSATPVDYSKCFILTEDIDLEGQVFTKAIIAPDNIDDNTRYSNGIYYVNFQGAAFTGIFDGNSHRITNFSIQSGSDDCLGLFGQISTGGQVKNLGIENVAVNSSSGSYCVGGLAGYNYYGIINQCYSTGNANRGFYSGGLIGFNNCGTVEDCYAIGDIVNGVDVGGLIGCNLTGLVRDSYASGTTTGSMDVGGLIGFNLNSNVYDCHAIGSMKGSFTYSNVGGLVGYNVSSSIMNCYAISNVSGKSYLGGLVGVNVMWESSASSEINNCYALSNISGFSNSYNLGGLVGMNMGNIILCSSGGTITGSSEIGGLVGFNFKGTISSSYSTSTVTGNESIGDLSGINTGTINNCFSMGDVSGSYSGGLIGENGSLYASNGIGKVTNCYSAGTIYGESNIGGLVGENYSGSTIDNSFWDIQTSGLHTSDGGVGKTTAEMQTLITFTSVGWHFVPPWSMWISGHKGNALSFDGADDYVEISGYKGIIGTASRTCSAWIKTTTIQQSNIVSWGGVQNGQRWLFRVDANGVLALGVGGGYVATITKVNDGQWHQVVAVLNSNGSPSVNEVLLYIDGILQSTTASSSQTIDTIASQNVLIGAFQNSGVATGFFSGMLDEVCIYNRPLNTDEIDPDIPISTEGLIACWAMDEMEGNIVHDSASSYNGRLMNECIWFMREGIDCPRLVGLNQIPLADTGEDQALYAWIDGIADATLDGSASYDKDGDVLTYQWNWMLDGTMYEAEGINPTIELPVGQHIISLIVNDGIIDSSPSEVVITVIEPIEADLNIIPNVLNCRSKLPKIIAVMRLPKGITKEDIDTAQALLLYPGQIEADSMWISKTVDPKCRDRRVLITASFDVEELMDAVDGVGQTEFALVGQLKTGQYFFGKDKIKIICPTSHPKHRFWHDHRWIRRCRRIVAEK